MKAFFTINLVCSFLLVFAQNITRGPYLQTPTSSDIIVIWRTSSPTNSTVWYGADPNALNNQINQSASVNQHVVQIPNLQAYTKYYYAVGYGNTMLSTPDSNHYFITSPLPYTEQNIRIWATGDFGKGNQGQIETKQSFENYTRAQGIDPDIWIWLGDNAYQDGKDSEYQSNVFGLAGYSDIFSWLPFWPSPGNHDYNTIWSNNGILGIPYTLSSISDHDGPYYDIVDVPEQAEAGGYPSTHEVFYSFDYGNTHLLSLNSEVYHITNNNVLNQMKTFIHQDLQQNDKDWVIAYWHQPPYSKGSHDSDDFYEDVMKDMREEIVPILESYDVDLIICGHSHVYERSYLIHGHYDYSNTFNPSMIIDNSDGNKANGNAYIKNSFSSAPQGTVYAVVGNAGSSEGNIGSPHPVMSSVYSGDGNYGSLILDVYKNEIRGRHLASTGQIVDDFSIIKQNMELVEMNDHIICQGDSIPLFGQHLKGSDSIEYRWMPGNLLGDTVMVSPSTTSTYVLKITDLLSGQILYDTTLVQVVNLPASVSITENNGVLSTVSGYNYQWYLNGTSINGAQSASYTPTAQGFYSVVVSGSSSCSVTSSIFSNYDLNLTIASDQTSLCAGDSVILFLSATGGSDSVSLSWLNFPNEALNFYYPMSASEEIIAQAIDYISGEIEMDTLFIEVYPNPDTPTISQFGNLLTTDMLPAYSYQWFFNGNAIPGASSSEYLATQSGNYQVMLTNANSCSSLSLEFNLVISSILNFNSEVENFIYPNPNKGEFTISIDEEILGLEVFNSLGEEISYTYNTNKTCRIEEAQSGIYYIRVETKEGAIVNKIVIE
ncbi:MAG: metallophosphoesterase [Chitinophagales bacterium]|nr:metallophosphoesterase [Chitinophagales bacterium]